VLTAVTFTHGRRSPVTAGPTWGYAGQPAAGLGRHTAGAFDCGGQLVDRATGPDPPAHLGQGTTGVGQHCARIDGATLSQPGQLPGDG
jgi:hypothetical protein